MVKEYDFKGLVSEVVSRGLDLAATYEDWTRAAFALSALGEDGRALFHAVSSVSPSYRERENDLKFDEALRNCREIGAGTFVKMCGDAGVDVGKYARRGKGQAGRVGRLPVRRAVPLADLPPVEYVPPSVVGRQRSMRNTLFRFLYGLMGGDEAARRTLEGVAEDYRIGSTRTGDVIFWQIDKEGRVHDGKIQHYKLDGHRTGLVRWVHHELRRRGTLTGRKPPQCLFGEHLLCKYPGKPVAVVESEKNAVIGSAVFPGFCWVATGCKGGLNVDRLRVLAGRDVVLFPDVDGYAEWCGKAGEMRAYCRAVVSDLLERNATEAERAAKIDIADWIVRGLQERQKGNPAACGACPGAGAAEVLSRMVEANPFFGMLVRSFGLVPVG